MNDKGNKEQMELEGDNCKGKIFTLTIGRDEREKAVCGGHMSLPFMVTPYQKPLLALEVYDFIAPDYNHFLKNKRYKKYDRQNQNCNDNDNGYHGASEIRFHVFVSQIDFNRADFFIFADDVQPSDCIIAAQGIPAGNHLPVIIAFESHVNALVVSVDYIDCENLPVQHFRSKRLLKNIIIQRPKRLPEVFGQSLGCNVG